MTGYHDYILELILLVLLSIAGTLTVAGLQSITTVSAAVGVATSPIGHALFVDGSSSPSPSCLDEHAGPDVANVLSPLVLDAD